MFLWIRLLETNLEIHLEINDGFEAQDHIIFSRSFLVSLVKLIFLSFKIYYCFYVLMLISTFFFHNSLQQDMVRYNLHLLSSFRIFQNFIIISEIVNEKKNKLTETTVFFEQKSSHCSENKCAYNLSWWAENTFI